MQFDDDNIGIIQLLALDIEALLPDAKPRIHEKDMLDVNHREVVLATGLDRHFGSGYGSEPNRSQIGGPGRQ